MTGETYLRVWGDRKVSQSNLERLLINARSRSWLWKQEAPLTEPTYLKFAELEMLVMVPEFWVTPDVVKKLQEIGEDPQ